jgi:hypothetical protein
MQRGLRIAYLPTAPAEEQVPVHADGVSDGQLIVEVDVQCREKVVAPHWAPYQGRGSTCSPSNGANPTPSRHAGA